MDESNQLMDPLTWRHSDEEDEDVDSTNSKGNTESKPKSKPNTGILATLYAVLFTQWLLMTYISAFFPESDVGLLIDNSLQGSLSPVASTFVWRSE